VLEAPVGDVSLLGHEAAVGGDAWSFGAVGSQKEVAGGDVVPLGMCAGCGRRGRVIRVSESTAVDFKSTTAGHGDRGHRGEKEGCWHRRCAVGGAYGSSEATDGC
jgi:hypothetical protein